MEGDSVTLKEIEKWYGGETAHALAQYCDETGKAVDEVAASDREWNRFESWSKSKKRGLGRDAKKFGNWVKASRIDQKGAAQRLGKIYDRPVDSDIYGEGSGSRMDTYAISDNIWDYLEDCEWVENLDQVHYESFGNEIVFTVDGQNYIITVDKCE